MASSLKDLIKQAAQATALALLLTQAGYAEIFPIEPAEQQEV